MNLTNMITAVDVHACGEPGRVITGGVLDVPGDTMFAKMKWFEKNNDGLRQRMLREPRGYPALCCNVILPPTHPEADVGFVIMEQTEYPAMSGSNTICVTTALLETGMYPMQEPITELVLEAPAGLIKVQAECANGKVQRVKFQNVPAFAIHLDQEIDVPHLGKVTVDVAWGGMFFAIADAASVGIELVPENGSKITRAAEMIKSAANEQLPVVHPDWPTHPPRCRLEECRNCIIWYLGLGQTGDLDRRTRSLPLWDGYLCQDGRSPCQRRTGAAPAFPSREYSQYNFYW